MPERSKHIRSSFDGCALRFKERRFNVLMMSSLTDRIFQAAVEGLLNRDSDLCSQVVGNDDEIDILERQVDLDGVNLLLRFHPVASDMREVISALKVGTSLERIADQSVTIARRAKRLNARSAMHELALLEPPYRLALTIFRGFCRWRLRACKDAQAEGQGARRLNR
jgi:phosphate transport system protein